MTRCPRQRLSLELLGALDDGRLVGILGYRRVGAVVDVDRLAVHPSFFRQGIARSLLEELHRIEADAARFEVSTAAGNQPAIGLYDALGYRPVGDRTFPGVVVVLLARDAAPS
jgi:ribosomal protein S18 acetylase RimI-like enzyme